MYHEPTVRTQKDRPFVLAIGILDSTGTQVVTYTYDAWGNPISTSGSAAGTIGVINPFRYRGYYYDEETGFYYLNSRYYDPGTGRFINADGLIQSGDALLGTNMYAYCNNNPVNYSDPFGNDSESVWEAMWRALLGILAPPPPPAPVAPAPSSPTPSLSPAFDGHSSSANLTETQKEENAKFIYNYLTDQGWSKEAICGLLGNIDVESFINPGRMQDNEDGSYGPGYGLVQWDPGSKYLDWAAANGYSATSLTGQLEFLLYSMGEGKGEWLHELGRVPLEYRMEQGAFISSNASPDYLAMVFMHCYERPGTEHADRRKTQALYWYNTL